MKKYMITAAAALLFAGFTNAQSPKHPAKSSPAKETASTGKSAAQHKSAAATTTSVTPQTPSTGKGTPAATTIKRKHHSKKKAAKAPAAK